MSFVTQLIATDTSVAYWWKITHGLKEIGCGYFKHPIGKRTHEQPLVVVEALLFEIAFITWAPQGPSLPELMCHEVIELSINEPIIVHINFQQHHESYGGCHEPWISMAFMILSNLDDDKWAVTAKSWGEPLQLQSQLQNDSNIVEREMGAVFIYSQYFVHIMFIFF